MPYLKRLAIRTYRSIAKADLKLGEITVIIGASDTGKSNVVRAFRDWAYAAGGEDMVSLGSTVTRVAVVLGEAVKVVWERVTSTNGNRSTGGKGPEARGTGGMRYVVSSPEHERPRSYEKIGTSVPQDVTDITGFRRLKVDDVTIQLNVAEQKDPWFLLVSPPWTPGKTTKVIGVVSGVEALILGNRDMVLMKQRENGLVKASTEAVAKAEEELKEFVALDEGQALVAQASEVLAKLVAERTHLDQATNLLKSIAAARAKAARVAVLAEAAQACLELGQSLGLLDDVDKLANARDLERLVLTKQQQVVRAQETLRTARERVEAEKAAMIAAATGGDLMCPLCGESAHGECREAILEQAREA